MKILIWILCILANVSITTILKQNGVILGAIPAVILFSLTMGCARTLCIKWEEHKNNKQKRIIATTETIGEEVDEINDKIVFCRKCGFKLIDDSEFCSNCGTNVIK